MNVVLIFVAVGAALEILQNTLLSFIAIHGVQPDLVLIVATYTAFRFGTQIGQASGFLMGIIEDAVAVTPFGFHSAARLLHSNIIGMANGSVSLDMVVMPVVLTLTASILKILTFAAITAVFSLGEIVNPVWTIATLIEVAFTVGIAPLVFLLLNKIPVKNG